ncbi:MAG: 30S ribosomal protein S19e [Candidatus Aenigmarchaeota archaeon]|nr:30S ribosomal protein S19e [Candidatus Aenigmarchaeota archaeon]
MKNVSPQKLIATMSERLQKNETMKQPDWSKFIKTGVNTEKPPVQKNWWFVRSAAILRRVYLNGPVGVEKLRNAFGGRKERGHKPSRHAKSGGKIIRTILQQLEKAGYIKTVDAPKKGRVITPKGQRFLERSGREIR